MAARTQSVNNLKQIGLGMQSFVDGNKRLPFNGIAPGAKSNPEDATLTYYGNAVTDCETSGSWLFQILPYVDQQTMFHLSGDAGSDVIPVQFRTAGVATYMCPARGRQAYEDGVGPWSDYFINNYLNDPANADKTDNPDGRLSLQGIKDGSSNTIFAGHGNIATVDYNKTKNVSGSGAIFVGGTPGTARGGPKWVKGARPRVSHQRDAATLPAFAAGGWGGPYEQGMLAVWCDGTVRMVPYTTPSDVFGAYLTPAGSEEVALPD
jgi:hypothetical protein